MNIYVATKWENMGRARETMALLTRQGHHITYDWTRCEQFSPEQALRDVQGVLDADALVFLADEGFQYKGAYVEFGIAVARGIPIYVDGPAIDTCLFVRLPQVVRGLPPYTERAA